MNPLKMPSLTLLALLILLFLIPLSSPYQYEKPALDSLKLKASFDYLSEQSVHSPCFKSTFTSLTQQKCREMPEASKIRVALRLAGCFYEISGRAFDLCDLEAAEPKDCAKRLKNDEWNTYLSFFNHVDNLCFYYRTQTWQEESEKLINSLFDSASTSKTLLKQNIEKTYEIAELNGKIDRDLQQQFSAYLQRNQEIKESYSNLSTKTDRILTAFDSIDSRLASHDSRIQEIFVKIAGKIENILMILNWLSLEVFDIKTGLYYFLLLFFSILLTSVQSLSQARAFVLLTVLLNFSVEKILINNAVLDSQVALSNIVFFLRSAVCLCILAKLSHCYASFRDYNELTYLEVLEIAKKQRFGDQSSEVLKKRMRSVLADILESQRKRLVKASGSFILEGATTVKETQYQ